MRGDKCEMVRWLLEPRVYLRHSSSDFLTRVCRKGEDSPHLKGGKTKLNRGHIWHERGHKGGIIFVKYSNET